jgi:Uma2 family endonuclease
VSATLSPVIEYPASDGQPMAETGIHVQAIIHLHQALQDFFSDRRDVFIASDMFWYWKEGETDDSSRVAPDVMVVEGVGNHQRRTFNSFDEGGAVPAMVFEMASRDTWRDDENDKYRHYEQLGVREYVMFDPEGLYLSSPVKAYRLNNSAYRRIYQRGGEYQSDLGFRMRAEGTMLRLVNGRTGLPILTRAEQVEVARGVADEAIRMAEQEKRRADALQAELDRLRALFQPPSGNGT